METSISIILILSWFSYGYFFKAKYDIKIELHNALNTTECQVHKFFLQATFYWLVAEKNIHV